MALLPVGWDNLFIIQPRVVTVDPMKERPVDRDNLHKVAEAAKKMRGHYRFFGYTDGTVAQKSAFNAPAGMKHWPSGEGTRATNCSSFIWAAAKDAGFHLEGPADTISEADLEELDKKLAKADKSTVDGLYFYDEKERTIAAGALHEYQRQHVIAELKAKSSSFLGPVIDDITGVADTVANQLLNAFASDAVGDIDSTAWSTPGIGRSVSPDNLMLWDAPGTRVGLYGYSVMEAKYDSASWTKERISRWLPANPATLTIRGRVLYHGKPAAGAHVVVSCREAFTDAGGRFEFPSSSEGRYLATATVYWKMGDKAPPLLLRGERPIVISPATTDFVIELMDPPETVRDITITGWGEIVDPGVLSPTHSGKFFFMETIRVATEEAGGGVLKPVGSTSHDTATEPIGLVGHEAHCIFGFNATLQPDLSVLVHYEAKIMKHDDFGGLIEGDWVVPMDASVSSASPGKVFGSAEVSGRNSCTFSFTIANTMHTSGA